MNGWGPCPQPWTPDRLALVRLRVERHAAEHGQSPLIAANRLNIPIWLYERAFAAVKRDTANVVAAKPDQPKDETPMVKKPKKNESDMTRTTTLEEKAELVKEIEAYASAQGVSKSAAAEALEIPYHRYTYAKKQLALLEVEADEDETEDDDDSKDDAKAAEAERPGDDYIVSRVTSIGRASDSSVRLRVLLIEGSTEDVAELLSKIIPR